MSKTSIPLTISSKLTNLDTGATLLQATPYANATGTTTDKAPVLLALESERTVGADEFAAGMREAGGQGTAAQARLVVNAVASVIADLVEKYGAISVQTPFGTVETFISSSIANAHDTPDPEVNHAWLGVVIPEAYRRQFAQIETYIPADACPAKLKRVRDKATGKAVIVGTDEFYLEGYGMTQGGPGETLALHDAAGEKLCDIDVKSQEQPSEIQHVCSLVPQTAIPKGRHVIHMTTLAGGESTLWPLTLPVELAEAVEPPPANPTLTKVHPSDEPENDGWMKPNPYENTVEGTNLATATKLEFKYVDGEDEYVDEFEIVSKTADRIVFKANASTLTDIGGHLIVTTPAGTCEGDFMATVMGL